eukprot:SAG22_NODE_678_length_7959_cov_8.441985_4_plen_335_part_00
MQGMSGMMAGPMGGGGTCGGAGMAGGVVAAPNWQYSSPGAAATLLHENALLQQIPGEDHDSLGTAEPPEVGSAEEIQLVNDFKRQLVATRTLDLRQRPHLLWSAACLRSCGYRKKRAQQSFVSYLEWRKALEIDLLGTPLNASVRSCLASGWLQQTAGHDRGGRPVLQLFAREFDPAAAVEDVVRAAHWLVESTYRASAAHQREGFCLVVDCTGADGSSAAKALLAGGKAFEVVSRLAFIPARLAVLIGLNVGSGRLQSPWRRMIRDELPAGTEVRTLDTESNSGSVVEALAPLIDEDQLLADHGGSLAYDHRAAIEALEAEMFAAEEGWPWLA